MTNIYKTKKRKTYLQNNKRKSKRNQRNKEMNKY